MRKQVLNFPANALNGSIAEFPAAATGHWHDLDLLLILRLNILDADGQGWLP